MSAWIKSYSLADLSDQSLIVAQIECDTLADLPAVNAFTGRTLVKGSVAHVIDGNTEHELNSTGQWILQDKSPYSDVYTKSQIDSLLQNIESSMATEETTRRLQIAALIDSGAKNRLNVFATASQSIAGIQWMINSDGTVSATGTASANSFLYLIPNNTNIAFGIETHISGCPAGGSSTTHEIQVAMVGGKTYHDYGDGETIPSTYVYRYFVCCVRSGQNIPTSSPLIFRPMICDQWKYELTNTFSPYSPSNAELAALIRGYHS